MWSSTPQPPSKTWWTRARPLLKGPLGTSVASPTATVAAPQPLGLVHTRFECLLGSRPNRGVLVLKEKSTCEKNFCVL